MPKQTDPFEAMEKLKRALTSSDPGPHDFLTVPRVDSQYAYGSVVPALTGTMYLDRSGLYVPASVARPVSPLDQMMLFITPEDLVGYRMPVEDIARLISEVPLEHAVNWASSIVGALYNPGRDRREVELEYIERYYSEDLKVRARNLLRDPTRVLLIPQALMVFVKLAFALCKPCNDPAVEAELRPMVLALMQIPAHLDSGVDGLKDGEGLVVTKDPNDLGAYMIANQMFNAGADEKTSWGTFQRCWREMPVELADHPRVINLEKTYEDVTGVPLDDLVALCAVFWTTAASGAATVEMNYLDGLGWSSERLDRVLALIAATPEQMTQMLADDVVNNGMAWSTQSFQQYPVIRWNTQLTVLDPDLLIKRSTGMWPLYDILRVLEAENDNPKLRGQVKGCMDHLYEELARESLTGITGPDRLYSESAIKAAYGKKKRVADAAADYGHAWVVADVTTTGFKLPTAAGNNLDSIARDLDQVVEKARQIEATIDHLRADETKLTKADAFPGRRTFYPVLIIAAKFAASPITMTILRERLAEARVLQADDIERLEVMELEDLLSLEGAVESDGLDMLSILVEKTTASMSMMSMRHFLAEKLGRNVPHPDRIQTRWETWFRTAIEDLRTTAEAQAKAS